MDFTQTFQANAKCNNINHVWSHFYKILVVLKYHRHPWVNIFDTDMCRSINIPKEASLELIIDLLNEKALLLKMQNQGRGTNTPSVPMVLNYVLKTTFPFIFFHRYEIQSHCCVAISFIFSLQKSRPKWCNKSIKNSHFPSISYYFHIPKIFLIFFSSHWKK